MYPGPPFDDIRTTYVTISQSLIKTRKKNQEWHSFGAWPLVVDCNTIRVGGWLAISDSVSALKYREIDVPHLTQRREMAKKDILSEGEQVLLLLSSGGFLLALLWQLRMSSWRKAEGNKVHCPIQTTHPSTVCSLRERGVKAAVIARRRRRRLFTADRRCH